MHLATVHRVALLCWGVLLEALKIILMYIFKSTIGGSANPKPATRGSDHQLKYYVATQHYRRLLTHDNDILTNTLYSQVGTSERGICLLRQMPRTVVLLPRGIAFWKKT